MALTARAADFAVSELKKGKPDNDAGYYKS